MTENEEKLKILLMKVKEESEKADIKKATIMASDPISSWQIEGEKLEAVADFLFLGSQITMGGDCSHEIKKKKHLLLGRKSMTNEDNITKSRGITLLINDLCSQSYVLFQCVCVSCSVVSDSLIPHGLLSARLLCPWNSPGKNTGVGGPALLQGIFPTQGLNPGLLHCRRILYYLSYQGSSFYLVIRYKCESWTIEKAEY